ncbi:MAG: VOC family protein [Dehalococcoidia bacterium]|nr:VOC family protein [Dehalococcoidia bacterium]
MSAQKITTFLWFDNQTEAAMEFYTSIFKNSRIVEVNRFENAGPEGETVVTGTFELEGQQFMALDGGPLFKFTEAISLYVDCETQEEVDYYWDKLTADGGEPSQCGWLKDKFGLSWQIVPRKLNELMADSDPKKSQAVMQAMLQMGKIEVSQLQQAYDQA